MARRKVKLAFIANDSARKASFRKRKNGLLKKMKELSTLCDVTVTAIIYNPGETQPEIWPPSVSEVNAALSKFREMPEMNQRKKMMDQERFLMQQISKVGDQYKKQAHENRDKEVLLTMYGNLDGTLGLQGMSSADLEELGRVIDKTLTEINDSRQRMLITDNKHVVDDLRWLSSPPPPIIEERELPEIKSVDQYVPYWSIDLMNSLPPPPPQQMNILPPPPPQMQPQMVGDYFFNGGDCSGGGYIVGGDQQNVTSMFPLFGDNQYQNDNFNATSSSSINNNMWPKHNSNSNLFYP